MSRPTVHSWKISAIYEVNNFLTRKSWIPIKMSKVKAKDRNPVPLKWEFSSKEEPVVLIRPKSRNEVKGYVKAPGVD